MGVVYGQGLIWLPSNVILSVASTFLVLASFWHGLIWLAGAMLTSATHL